MKVEESKVTITEKKSNLAEEIITAGAIIAGIAALISLLGGENSKKK